MWNFQVNHSNNLEKEGTRCYNLRNDERKLWKAFLTTPIEVKHWGNLLSQKKKKDYEGVSRCDRNLVLSSIQNQTKQNSQEINCREQFGMS